MTAVGKKGDFVSETRKTIEKVLSNEKIFRQSAMSSFKQFDKNRNELMEFDELRAFFERLCTNLSIPPIQETALLALFEKYDSDDQAALNRDDFCRMYRAMLYRIRDRYYPPKIDVIRSTLFIPTNSLERKGDLLSRISFDKRLGSGCFGEVYLVTDLRCNAQRACKIINKLKVAVPLEQIEAEIKILKSMDHPNVIRIFEIFEDPNSIYILQEYCEGGELLTTLMIDLGKAAINDELFVRRVMRQIFEGLTHIHTKRVMHKDLKPENILFVNSSPNSPVKIIDFGLGELFHSDSDMITTVLRGSAIYMAPEAFREGRLCLKSDVWSAGCIMYNLMTGKFPFDAPDEDRFRTVILKKELDLCATCGHVSQEARDLLAWIFQKMPYERCSAREALNHPWFAESTQLSHFNLSESICLNMKRFAKQQGLRNLFIDMMAHQLSIKNENVSRIGNLFKRLDRDNRGVLSPPLLRQALLDAGLTQWDANLIVQQLDVRGQGEISYREFLAACYSWRESEMHLVWMAFQRLPTCGGRDAVSVDDLRDLLMRKDCRTEDGLRSSLLFQRNDNSEIEKMISEMDADGDGYIGWSEFENYVRSGSAHSHRERQVESIALGISLLPPDSLFEKELPRDEDLSTDCSPH